MTTIREARIPAAHADPDTASPADAGTRQTSVALQHGRHLSIAANGEDDLVEIRNPEGSLELRVRMTAEGPVLQMESLRLSLKAAQDVEVECANFSVRSSEQMTLQSDGALRISGEADVHMDANGEVHVKGTLIHLN
jgi:hypothetical protein